MPLHKELVAQIAEVYQHLLNAVATYGEIGNVTNWQQHLLPTLLNQPGQELAAILGEPLPADAAPGTEYQGAPRLFVPTLRGCLTSGEPLVVKAIVLAAPPGKWPCICGDLARASSRRRLCSTSRAVCTPCDCRCRRTPARWSIMFRPWRMEE